jgi:hypothetical protein
MNWKKMKLHDGNYPNRRRMYDRSEKWRGHAAGLSLFGSVSELRQLALKALINKFFVERLEESLSLSC